MKNIINILKHGFKKNRIVSGVILFIYILLMAGVTSLVGNGVTVFLNFFFVMISLILMPIICFFKFTRRLSKENALLFLAPIKGHEYIIAKVIEYMLVAAPIVIVFYSQILLVNKAYVGVLAMVHFVEFTMIAVGVAYILGIVAYLQMICLFIGTKVYIKKYALNIMAVIGGFFLIEVIKEIISDLIHIVSPYYYVQIIEIRIGVLDIIFELIVLVGLYIIGKKALDKGIDFN